MELGAILKKDFSGTVLEPLLELTDCPRHMYYRGTLPTRKGKRFITVVGSRKISPYAKQALETIIRDLAGQAVTIVSGLALGADALAHRLALLHGLPTIAIPGSGLDSTVLYPASNRQLAEEIINQGGVLLSEFEPQDTARMWTFPKRNRIMARLADLVLVVEAGEKSGTLITARNASEYSVEVGVIPGSIFNQGAIGSNNLLKEGGQVITSADDILNILGMTKTTQGNHSYDDVGPDEQAILSLLVEPQTRDDLLEQSGFDTVTLSTTISLLEIKGYVKEELGLIYKI